MPLKPVLTLFLAAICAVFVAASPAAAQTEADGFAVPGCMDVVNADYYACRERARAMAAAGVEQRDAASMAQAWRMVCSFKDRESCEEAARLYTQGGPGLTPDLRIAANFHARACEFRSEASCEAALEWFSRPGSKARDIRRLAFLFNDQCAQGSAQACEKGAFIVANGFGDRFDGMLDVTLARTMAEKGCKSGRSANSCLLAEVLYGDSSYGGADPARSLSYAEMNCTAGEDTSCLRLGGIAQGRDDWPTAARYYQRACTLGSGAGCRHSADARKMLAYIEQEQQAKAPMRNALQARDFAGATYVAIYQYGSRDQLAEAIRYIKGKGMMSAVPTNHLYVVSSWFPSGDVHDAAEYEMRRRGTGLEGTFGTGTNNAGQASARWNASRGSTGSSYSAPSGSSFTPMRVPSAAEIASQTRKKYHHNNCVMSKIPNNPNC